MCCIYFVCYTHAVMATTMQAIIVAIAAIAIPSAIIDCILFMLLLFSCYVYIIHMISYSDCMTFAY